MTINIDSRETGSIIDHCRTVGFRAAVFENHVGPVPEGTFMATDANGDLVEGSFIADFITVMKRHKIRLLEGLTFRMDADMEIFEIRNMHLVRKEEDDK